MYEKDLDKCLLDGLGFVITTLRVKEKERKEEEDSPALYIDRLISHDVPLFGY